MSTNLADIGSKVQTITGVTPYLGKMPATPDLAIAIYETGGQPPDLGLGMPGLKFEYPTFQIVCRGVKEDYPTPRALAEQIFLGLPQNQAVTINGTVWFLIKPRQSPFLLGRDEEQRVLIACNYLCEKVPTV